MLEGGPAKVAKMIWGLEHRPHEGRLRELGLEEGRLRGDAINP